MKNTFLLFLALLLSASLPAQPLPFSKTEFEKLVMQVMKEYEVPGISIALVKDGNVILTKGFGKRKLGMSAPVDEHTVFGIASNTKAFTATAMALLAEEGKLSWNDRVIDYLPWFRLSDPYVTKELRIRDLFVHRSGLGLGAGDLLWWPKTVYDRKEIVRRLRHLPLAASFRSAYAYDNVLYTVAGEVIEAVSGMSWEEFMQQRILRPVGMNESTVLHSDAANEGNIASTHARVNGTVQIVQPFLSDITNPAGGINSNAVDMAKWLLVQLDSGKISNEKRLFRSSTTKELWSFITPKPISAPPKELAPMKANFSGYGLGFNIQDYRGVKMITHTGGLPGYVSRVTMIPELNLGIAVLTNQEEEAAFMILTNYLLDRFMNAAKFDWLNAYLTLRKRDAEKKSFVEKSAEQTPQSPPLPIEKYCGTFRDAWYGEMSVSKNNDSLEIRFHQTPALIGSLHYYRYTTFIARWYNRELRADAYVTFSFNPDGSIESIHMSAVSPETDFSYDFQDLKFMPMK